MLTTCATCGQPATAAGSFCIGCGQPVARACRQCGGPVAAGDQWCVTCGTAIVEGAAVAPQTAPSTPPPPALLVPSAPAQPQSAPAQPQSAPAQPQSAPAQFYAAGVVPAARSGRAGAMLRSARRRPVVLIAGTLAVVVAFVATIAFAGMLPIGSNGKSPAASAGSSYPTVVKPALVELKQVASTDVAGNGTKVADTHGVTVVLAKSSLVGASAIHLVASDLPAAYDASLSSEDGWKRVSAAYSLELDKGSDVAGTVPLSFPSSSADDRVVVLMDRRYPVILGVKPVNGRLVVQASATSSAEPAFEGEGDHYFVVTKSDTVLAPEAGNAALLRFDPQLGQQNDLADAAAASTATCTYKRFPPTTTCVNGDSSLIFTTATKLGSEWDARLGAFFGRAEAIMKKYAGLGFDHANPTADDPIRFEIDSGEGTDPRYTPNNIVSNKIYLGFGPVLNIGEPIDQQMLAHEMFHWVQHHIYPMRIDGHIVRRYWHIEMQAETASFLADPSYQAAELLRVAAIRQANGTQGVLGWQKAVGEWDSGLINMLPDASRYVQGQVVRLGICDGPSCIESQKDFVDEANKGWYTFSAIGYEFGLANAAQYLLGVAPTGVKVDLTAPILTTGRGIGDYIHVSQDPTHYTDITNFDNLTKNATSGEVAIHAAIASGGIYPLRVSNGSDVPLDKNCLPDSNQFSGSSLKPNAPYTIHLNAGVELYWRVGTGAVQHSDGSKPVDIGPITSEKAVAARNANGAWATTPGLPSVRIVAINPTKNAVSLSGNVAPLAPMAVATPDKIEKPDSTQETTMEINLTQVPLNFKSFTADWDFGDGSPVVKSTVTADAKMNATISMKHTITSASKGVRVTFSDQGGKALSWDPVVIHVGASPGSEDYNNLGIYMPIAGSNIALRQSINVKIKMTGARTFEMVSSDVPLYSLKGEISADGKSLSVTVLFQAPDASACPSKMVLRNLPFLGSDAPAILDDQYGVMGYSKVLAVTEYDWSYLNLKNEEVCQTIKDWNHYEENTGAMVIVTLYWGDPSQYSSRYPGRTGRQVDHPASLAARQSAVSFAEP